MGKTLNEQDYGLHVGVHITDTKSGEVIFSKDGSRNFVPASNTKILSLYAAMSTLGDSIPAFKYFQKNDTLFVLGTGDPTLLHPDFPESNALKILRKANVIVISDQNFDQSAYGAGWAWDDYNYYYQAEISPIPVYGNVLRAKLENNQIKLSPSYFEPSLKDTLNGSRTIVRKQWTNEFDYDSKVSRQPNFNQEIPFKTSISLTAKLLSQAINKPVLAQSFIVPQNMKLAYSQPVDTVLRKMMQQSDNLLAEQLLLLAGSTLSDTISTAKSIKNISEKLLSHVPQPYRWRDGSGLSRQNLFTPQMMVELLNKMYKEFPQERLFSLMSIGGKAGTLRNKYPSDIPYVFAKTGSLGGVYNESGFLIAKSGRLLTYSVMKNNFIGTTADNGKKTMEFVQWVRERY